MFIVFHYVLVIFTKHLEFDLDLLQIQFLADDNDGCNYNFDDNDDKNDHKHTNTKGFG